MLDTRSRTNSQRAALVRDLRKRLGEITDPDVRAFLENSIRELEAASPSAVSSSDARARVSRALEAAGLTADPGDDAPSLTDNARLVLERRYLLRGPGGEPLEDAQGMLWRVARAIAEADRLYAPAGAGPARTNGAHETSDRDVEETAAAFYRSMARLEFLPNSPTLMNAGTGAGTLSACFVLPLEDSMDAIMKTASDMAMVQKFGGGTGVALSRLRPRGAPISTTHGRACGPIAVLRHLSSVSTMITQGGKRDGANMAVMDVHHPDILEFVSCKQQEGTIHNFNISVGVGDAFMRAVEEGGALKVQDPRTGQPTGESRDASDIFRHIVEGAWRNGEPGLIFLDSVNRRQPTPHLGDITATNPCGEQPLLPHESCNLGSINLAKMLRYTGDGAEIDWDLLGRTVRLAVHFLDNVIDANRYSVPEIERMTRLTRKIGLGVMGFADMLVRLGIPYDSEEGLETARRAMGFIAREADTASAELAAVRGAFPAFKGSRLDTPGAPPMRNACRLTVAPTGTISMIAGCSSGIEPLFALAFRKHNILEGETLYYVDSSFEAVARHEGFFTDALASWLSQGNTLAHHPEAPEWARRLFATAPDIAPRWHVRMQAAFQEHTDAAISKTINFPNDATVEDVRQAYLLAWRLGCKGITVYRAGSREKEVLTAGTVAGRAAATAGAEGAPPLYGAAVHLLPRERPQTVHGVTERIRTGQGNMYVTINFDDDGRPFEVFTALGKAGGTDFAQLEALSRLVSMALRSGVDPEAIISQLRGITDSPVWDSGVLVRSAPDAVALALSRAIAAEASEPYSAQLPLLKGEALRKGAPRQSPMSVGETRPGAWGRCPECSGPLVFQEGCLMCRECGYNRCG